jgi:flagellar basal body L-ring protein FlgH
MRDGENEKMRNEKTSAVYDLSGRRISVSAATSVRSVLPKGIYIVNGKKVMIK